MKSEKERKVSKIKIILISILSGIILASATIVVITLLPKRNKDLTLKAYASDISVVKDYDLAFVPGASLTMGERPNMRFSVYISEAYYKDYITNSKYSVFGWVFYGVVEANNYSPVENTIGTAYKVTEYIMNSESAVTGKLCPFKEFKNELKYDETLEMYYYNIIYYDVPAFENNTGWNVEYKGFFYFMLSESGNVTYVCTDLESEGRSVAYVAEKALADESFGYTEEQKKYLQGYLSEPIYTVTYNYLTKVPNYWYAYGTSVTKENITISEAKNNALTNLGVKKLDLLDSKFLKWTVTFVDSTNATLTAEYSTVDFYYLDESGESDKLSFGLKNIEFYHFNSLTDIVREWEYFTDSETAEKYGDKSFYMYYVDVKEETALSTLLTAKSIDELKEGFLKLFGQMTYSGNVNFTHNQSIVYKPRLGNNWFGKGMALLNSKLFVEKELYDFYTVYLTNSEKEEEPFFSTGGADEWNDNDNAIVNWTEDVIGLDVDNPDELLEQLQRLLKLVLIISIGAAVIMVLINKEKKEKRKEGVNHNVSVKNNRQRIRLRRYWFCRI